jgi:hypothetical protein
MLQCSLVFHTNAQLPSFDKLNNGSFILDGHSSTPVVNPHPFDKNLVVNSNQYSVHCFRAHQTFCGLSSYQFSASGVVWQTVSYH